MATCRECGKSGFGFLEVKDGLCPQCLRERKAARASKTDDEIRREEQQLREALGKLTVTTETMVPEVTERLGVVTGQCALGMNIFRDFTAEVRDIVGGRSGAYQAAIKEAKDLCISEMKREAYKLGADAVIAMDLDFNEITGGGGLFGGKGMIMVIATGTAVTWAKPAEET